MSGYYHENKKTKTWYGRIDLPRHANGRRNQVRVHGRTEAEVKKKIRQVLNDAEQGLKDPNERRKYTIDNAIDTFLHSRRGRAFRTVESYEAESRRHIRPKIGSVAVVALTAGMIQDLIADWEEEGIGNNSIRSYLTLLSMILKRVRLDKYRPDNPMEEVSRPEFIEPEVPALTPEEAGSVLDALSGTALLLPYLTQVSQGTRPGEILGFLRSDVDVDNGVISVTGALEYRGKRLERKVVKTRAGFRTLYPPLSIMEAIVQHLDDQAARLSAIGIPVRDETPLFDDGYGGIWHPDSFRRAYTRILKRAGIKHVQWRGARHTFATLLDEKGDHDIVQRIMGHRSYDTTKKHYVDKRRKMNPAKARAVGEAFLSELEPFYKVKGDGALGSIESVRRASSAED